MQCCTFLNNLAAGTPNDIFTGDVTPYYPLVSGWSFTCDNTQAIVDYDDPAAASACTGSATDSACAASPPSPTPTPGGCSASKRAFASTSPGGKVTPSDFFTYVLR